MTVSSLQMEQCQLLLCYVQKLKNVDAILLNKLRQQYIDNGEYVNFLRLAVYLQSVAHGFVYYDSKSSDRLQRVFSINYSSSECDASNMNQSDQIKFLRDTCIHLLSQNQNQILLDKPNEDGVSKWLDYSVSIKDMNDMKQDPYALFVNDITGSQKHQLDPGSSCNLNAELSSGSSSLQYYKQRIETLNNKVIAKSNLLASNNEKQLHDTIPICQRLEAETRNLEQSTQLKDKKSLQLQEIAETITKVERQVQTENLRINDKTPLVKLQNACSQLQDDLIHTNIYSQITRHSAFIEK
ncbi:hypothetical protein MIR68_000354 [Amoeboaphelidium protococcarum]|nr:hypothetical protein MIR68_000354 [Amoeboaphelidium protococcarum]